VFKDTPETKAYVAGLRALALRIRQADRFVGPDNRIITKEAIIDRNLNEQSRPEYNRLQRLAIAQKRASEIKTSGPFSLSENLAGRELLNALGHDVGVVGDCHCTDYPERMASIDASGVNGLRQAVVADWSREPRAVHIGGPAFNQHLDYASIDGS
jgi:hypothetical protein